MPVFRLGAIASDDNPHPVTAVQKGLGAVIARTRSAVAYLVLLALLTGCAAPPAPSAPSSDQPSAPAATQRTAPKRIAAVIMGDPPAFTGAATPTGMQRLLSGADAIEELVQAGFSNYAHDGTLRPQLATAIPSLDNGQWRLEPDGRMELTWKIRPGATWQDGTPVTSDDFIFSATVARDRDLPFFGSAAWGQVERITAPDQSTVTVLWKQTYIHADALFSRSTTWPMPKHLLAQTYQENKAEFSQLPYWGREFVGAGPFRVRELVSGTRIVLDAYDGYALGRPRIGGIDITIVPDSNALVTHILSGAAQLTLGGRISVDQSLQIRDRWAEGGMANDPSSLVATYPQFLGADPPIASNVQFIRALHYATDREQLVNTLMQGVTQVADTTVAPNAREFADIQSSIVRYPYDPRRATQMIEELGYTKGSDGMFRDASGTRLTIEARATSVSDIQPKALAAIAGYWRQLGVGVDEVVIPNQRTQDLEYRQSRPGFEVLSQSNDPEFFRGLRTSFHSANIPLPQNRFGGGNRSRFSNPEMDARIEEYFVTIPLTQRLDVLRQIVRLSGEQLPLMGLFYNASFVVVGRQLREVGGRGPNSTEAWNSEQWDAL